MPPTPSTLMEGLPLDVCISFSKAVHAFLAISPEIATFIPQEATPASGHSALWWGSIEGQQGAWTCLQTAFWRQNIPVNLLGKMNVVEPCYYKK